MPVREILLLGNPVLRQPCASVKMPLNDSIRTTIADLRDTLSDFRSRRGFGRGIAAPQIGSGRKIIYVNADYTGPMINPTIVRRSRKKFRLWDDCFSFPDLLVKVRRHRSVVVEYLDDKGHESKLRATGPMAELLQHEIDHLNGVLALDRTISTRHIVIRSQWKSSS